MNAVDIQLHNPPQLSFQRADLQISTLPLSQKIILRGDFTDPVTLSVLRQLDLEAPTTNSFTGNSQAELFWLGPDELLLNVPDEANRTDIQHALQTLTLQEPATCYQVEVSDYYHQLIIRDENQAVLLHSQAAQHLLSQLFQLDLHPDVFQPGRCQQTLCQQAPVLISYHQTNAEPLSTCLRIQYRASYHDYIWQYLAC